MNAKTATAIAMAVTLVTVGLSAMPHAGALQSNCTGDEYVISDDKNNPTVRTLQGDMEVGLAEVDFLDGDRTLFVNVIENDGDLTLDVDVFDASASCGSICDFGVTGTNDGACDLDAPASPGTNDYYVHLEESVVTDEIKFEIWHEPR